jgi:hypothetical protein
VTNALGHQLATSVGDQTTLGVYRRGNRLPWVPGALIDAWVPCARGEFATGVPSTHVYFVQTLGERAAESGSIHCPACRAELAERRASGAPVPSRPAPRPAPAPQSALPF